MFSLDNVGRFSEFSFLTTGTVVAIFTVILWEIFNFVDEKYKIPLIPRSGWAQAVAVGIMVLISLLFYGPPQTFMYFQF